MVKLNDAALARLQHSLKTPDLDSTPYEFIAQIGSGGMGTVYRVRDTRLQREVALKVLHDSFTKDAYEQRLRREAQIVGALEHPGIVPLYDIGRLADGRLYYTMRVIRGQELDAWLGGNHEFSAIMRVFLTICRTVAFAHARNLIHRDLKPTNIRVTEFGGVYVLDWGVAKFLDPTAPVESPDCAAESPDLYPATHLNSRKPASSKLTSEGTLLGTPEFMPPEQFRGDSAAHDKRSDVFALGTIMAKIIDAQPTNLRMQLRRLGHRPAVLNAIVDRACAHDADDRYADAGKMASELEALLDGRRVMAYRENTLEKILRMAHKHRFVIALVGVYFLVRLFLYILSFFAA